MSLTLTHPNLCPHVIVARSGPLSGLTCQGGNEAVTTWLANRGLNCVIIVTVICIVVRRFCRLNVGRLSIISVGVKQNEINARVWFVVFGWEIFFYKTTLKNTTYSIYSISIYGTSNSDN